MPSIVDLAELSNAVYETSQSTCLVEGPASTAPASPGLPPVIKVPGLSLLQQTNACMSPQKAAPSSKTWSKVQQCYNRAGFHAALYACGDQRVIAFRGTDELVDALIDDAAIVTGSLPPQAVTALNTVSNWGFSNNTYLTGHSLGGALAILAACQFNLPAVTFNAPGVADVCVQVAVIANPMQQILAAVSRCVNHSRVRNIRIEGDPVSSVFTTGFQAGGNVQSYSASTCGFNALCRHGIATCVTAVRASNINFEELKL